jgi:hypothetical protein
MRSELVGSIAGIVLASVLLGMSEIAQSASAVIHGTGLLAGPTNSGAFADTQGSSAGKPLAISPSHNEAASGSVLCGGKPAVFTPQHGVVCAP